ncbi:MAG TPA: GerMN domain-containing protein [Actinomycetes bacterium]
MRPNPRRAATPAVLLAGLAVLLVGCGVPGQGTTRAVPTEDVPYGLLEPARDQPTATPSPGGIGVGGLPRAYFLDASLRLVAQPVQISESGTEAELVAVLDALEAGPTEQQRALGLASALAPTGGLRLLAVVDGTARIEVAPAAITPAADRLPLVVGQLVLSATSVQGVDQVVLVQDGQPVEAPLPGGEQTSNPLEAADYASLVAPAATPRVTVTPDR